MGTVAALVSGKGGTGKTTLCAGIGAGLARLEQRVLCIDADVGLRNLDLALGMSDQATIPFTEVLSDPDLLERVPAHPDIPGLSMLTAPVGTMPEDIDPEEFSALVTQAARVFDWVLIDAPAGIGPGFRLAASPSSIALVVANCEPASMRDAAQTAQLLRDREDLSLKLVVNRVRRRALKQLGLTIDDAIDQVGLTLIGLVPEQRRLPADLAAARALQMAYDGGAVQACGNIARRLNGERVPLLMR